MDVERAALLVVTLALRGAVWPGGEAPMLPDGVVLVDDGVVRALGPAAELALPDGVRTLGGAGFWVGPGIVDAHVHLAFAPGGPAQELAGGLVGVRDLGAPPGQAYAWQDSVAPRVWVVGPLLTAPDGYPSKSWGAAGFAEFMATPERARELVGTLVADGVDLVKIALEPAGGRPVPSLETARAVVDAAHAAGRAVTAHALTVAMVERALEAGVDELCHVPLEGLPVALVARIAAARIPVVSTIETLGDDAASNAALLHAAGVRLVYGTDLGNAGTRPGVDERELARLAAAGLGPPGALRSATEWAAQAAGASGLTGRITAGESAALVLLDADPLVDPTAWRRPSAVVVGEHLTTPAP